MAQFHIYNQTVADGTATSVVRPSDWNSVHSNLVTLSGNTAGVSTVSGTNIVYQGGSNVVVSGVQGANAATVIFSGSNQSVQTQASGNIAGIGYTSTTQAGSTVGATQNSNGLSMAWPPFLTTAQSPGAYLTTAMQSNESHVQNIIAGTNATGGTASLSNNVSFSNANGVSFFTSAGNAIVATVATNYQSQGAYLTTARASNDAVGLATAQTNVTWTVNSAGLSLNAGGYAGTTTGFTGANISGSMTHNSAGLALSLSAAAGGGGADGVNIVQIGTTGTTGTSFSSSNGTVFINGSNNITVSQNNSNQIVISGPTLTQYLTTARASNDAVGLNTALTANGVSWTVNSLGISLNVPAFLTTAALSNHSHNFATTTTNGSLIVVATTNSAGATIAVPSFLTTQSVQTQASGNIAGTSTGFTGANISGSMTNNSNGLALSLSVAAGGGGADGGNTLAVAGSTAGSNSLVLFSNSPTVTFGMAGNTITASAAGGGGGGALPLFLSYQNRQLGASSSTQFTNNQIWMVPFRIAGGSVSGNTIQFIRSLGGTYTSAAAATFGETIKWCLYSQDTAASSQLNTASSGSMTWQIWNSGTSSGSWAMNGSTSSSAGTGIMTQVSGVRMMDLPLATTVGSGLWMLALVNSTSSAGYSGLNSRYGVVVDAPMPLAMGLRFGPAAATNIGYVDAGTYSVTSAAFPSTVSLSQILQHSNLVPYFKIGAI